MRKDTLRRAFPFQSALLAVSFPPENLQNNGFNNDPLFQALDDYLLDTNAQIEVNQENAEVVNQQDDGPDSLDETLKANTLTAHQQELEIVQQMFLNG